MLLGEHKHNIDTKGRLIIPAKFRGDLGDRFILTRGLDGCLFGYPMEEWAILEEKLRQLPLGDQNSRKITRFFYANATECEFDKQGRISIPPALRQHAQLEKESYIIGVSNRFEIWSQENWETYADEADDSFDDISEDLINFGF